MRRVVVESPYAGPTDEAIRRNIEYARAAIKDSLSRGEAPFASHLLYTQPGVLRDDIPDERAIGIAAGLAWHGVADMIVFYTDLDMSPGMIRAKDFAFVLGLKIAIRSLPGWSR